MWITAVRLVSGGDGEFCLRMSWGCPGSLARSLQVSAYLNIP